MRYEELRTECCEANRELPKTGLVDMTFGNVSVLDAEKGVFAIKPSGVDFGDLRPEMIVILDLEGKVVDGTLRPSSDTPTHHCLYRQFAEDGVLSIVHTHSRTAVAFAQAGREIPCLGTTHADYFYGSVPLTRPMTAAEVQGEYEWNTGKVILERFKGLNPLELPGVLVNGHGPFAWNTSAAKALEVAVALESIAEMTLKSLSLNPNHPGIDQHLLDKHFLRKHGKTAYYGQE